MKTLTNIFYTIFVALLIGIALMLLATMVPIPGNIEVKIVKSGSMEPTIHTGSLVVVKPEADYKVGDIITFGADTKTQIPTTHRIIADQVADGKIYYTTKGDANEEQDSNKTPKELVIGKVIFTLPYAGFITDFARTKLGFVLLIALPAGIVIIDELMTIWGEAAALRRKKKAVVAEDTRNDS